MMDNPSVVRYDCHTSQVHITQSCSPLIASPCQNVSHCTHITIAFKSHGHVPSEFVRKVEDPFKIRLPGRFRTGPCLFCATEFTPAAEEAAGATAAGEGGSGCLVVVSLFLIKFFNAFESHKFITVEVSVSVCLQSRAEGNTFEFIADMWLR